MTDLFYRRSGSGRSLLVLHGLFGSSDNWNSIGRVWAERSDVFLVDARDHGRSPHTEKVTYELMAEDVLRLLDSHDLERVSIVGHSMGGKTAMRFAQLYPDRIDKLVVVDIGAREYGPHGHDAIIRALLSSEPGSKTGRSDMEAHLTGFIPEPGVVQFLMKSLYWKNPGELAWRFNVPVLARDMPHILSAIGTEKVHVPTLFIRGGKSDYIQREDLPQLHEQFTQATVESIPYAGHWVHAQAPDEVIEMVQGLLDS
ncbi:MAG: alpha/beta fold hydrolase [Flavobacteriales bacterium]|nr:alpha/beta fold hydrolase [Flavobacteriales bacterium]